MSNHVGGNLEFGGAARALNGDRFLALEEFPRLVAPGSERWQDPIQVAATIPAEAASFQETGFLRLLESGDVTGVDGREPLLVIVGLGREKDKGLVGQAEGPPWSLLGMLVELFSPFKGIGGGNLQRTAPRLLLGDGGL